MSEAAEAVRGYVHDPKEPDGPYIAVVLARGKAPVVSLHQSYAAAERELQASFAQAKETTLILSEGLVGGRADDHSKPVGPATDAVTRMEADIAEDRAKRMRLVGEEGLEPSKA